MKYVIASSDMANEICHVLHTAIKTIYPKYYPKEVVDFFCRHHSKEHVLKGIASGNMGVLMEGNVIVGTGALIRTILQAYTCCLLSKSGASARTL